MPLAMAIAVRRHKKKYLIPLEVYGKCYAVQQHTASCYTTELPAQDGK